MYVWGVAQRGVPMQVNVIGTLMFVIAIVIVVGAEMQPAAAGEGPRVMRVGSMRSRRGLPGAPSPTAYWLDDPAPATRAAAAGRAPTPPTSSSWAAATPDSGRRCCAKERDPDRDVLLLEAATCGYAASGRNGGFCEASLTHGFGNGLCALARRAGRADRLGPREPRRHRGDRRARTASTATSSGAGVARRGHRAAPGRRAAGGVARRRAHGIDRAGWTPTQLRERVDSPTYLGRRPRPRRRRSSSRPGWPGGCARACLRARASGSHEGTRASRVSRHGDGVDGRDAPRSRSRAPARGRSATNAFPPLLRRLRLMTVPVYDYVLITEPLTADQRAAIGWRGREGISDAGNQFHYYRHDPRRTGSCGAGTTRSTTTAARSAGVRPARPRPSSCWPTHFFETSRSWRGCGFSHRWAGVIDTCTRFTAFYGTAHGGRVGVRARASPGSASGRPGSARDVVLDLLHGDGHRATRLEMVRKKPVPFPPEPVRWAGIEADPPVARTRPTRNGGRQNLWLKAMDRLGLGSTRRPVR